MLLLLDTDGGEKNFNSPLIYSLPIKISVNVNYPNHFHAWHMKTEKSECLYFLLVEEKINWKYFQYLLIAYFSHPQCSHFPWSLDTAWAQITHTRQSRKTLQHTLPPLQGQTSSEVREEMFHVSYPSHGTALELWAHPCSSQPFAGQGKSPGGAVPWGQTVPSCSGPGPILLV